GKRTQFGHALAEAYHSGRDLQGELAMLRALTVAMLFAVPAVAQEHQHGAAPAEKLGTVRFATSCNADAQPSFARAMALLHSFEFARAIEGFSAALKTDPSCAIAEWGIAMSRWSNPFAIGIRPAAQLQPAGCRWQRGCSSGSSQCPIPR